MNDSYDKVTGTTVRAQLPFSNVMNGLPFVVVVGEVMRTDISNVLLITQIIRRFGFGF